MKPKTKDYYQGQIDMFNRIYDAGFNTKNEDDIIESLYNIFKELNKIREELTRKDR